MPALFPFETSGPNYVELKFRFQIDGTNDPDFIVGSEGMVSDIVRADVGEFEITLASAVRFQTLVTRRVDVDGDLTVTGQFVSYDSTTGVLVVKTIGQDGSPAVADPADDSWVNVELTLCKTSNGAPTKAI